MITGTKNETYNLLWTVNWASFSPGKNITEIGAELDETMMSFEELMETLGDRHITLAREITKKHETIEPMMLSQAIARYEEEDPRGEFVIVIEGLDVKKLEEEKKNSFEAMSVDEHVQMYVDQGMSKKDAIKQAAVDRGVPKRDVYNAVMK